MHIECIFFWVAVGMIIGATAIVTVALKYGGNKNKNDEKAASKREEDKNKAN